MSTFLKVILKLLLLVAGSYAIAVIAGGLISF